MKEKRFLVALALLLTIICLCALAACDVTNKPTESHTHNYQWVDNLDGTHKQHCANSGCNNPDINSGNHDYATSDTCVCGSVKPAQCNVIFNANGGKIDGKETKTIVAIVNQTISRPNDPVRIDYYFTGWYKDGETTALWDFDTDTVKEATTLYAGWVQDIRVTYDANGGKFSDNSQTKTVKVDLSDKLTAPETPTRENYIFTTWYKESSLTTEWDFDTDEVTGSTTLYAGWTEVAERDVTFVLNYNGVTDVVMSTVNGIITFIPTRTGYVFNGWWYSDGQTDDGFILSRKFDTTEIVTEDDLILYAEWVEESTVNSQLEAPIVSINQSVFSWVAVSGATGYNIRIYKSGSNVELKSETVFGTSWTFPDDMEAGYYSVRVRANGDGVSTVNSAFVSKSYAHNILGTISNISFDIFNSMLTWTAVKNATEYEFYIENRLIDTLTNTAFDFSEYDAGVYTVKIISKRSGYQSSTTIQTIEKKRLKTPQEINTVAVIEPDGYKITWDTVAHADTYILTVGSKEIRLADTSYVISCSADYWVGQYLTITLKAFDSSADYLISIATEEISLGKLYSLTIEENEENAGELAVNGKVYVPREYVVSFNLNGATGSVESQTITRSVGLTYPSLPTRSGYVFRGWYLDLACTQLYDFSAEVTQDLKLYAGWYRIPTSGNSMQIVDFTSEYNSSSGAYYASNKNTTSSKSNYVYFCTLTDGSHTFYYKNDTSGGVYYSTYFYVYNVTQNKIVLNTYTQSTSYLFINFTANAGDVFYIRNYRYYTGADYQSDYHFYVTGAKLPSAGGKVESKEYLEVAESNLSRVLVSCGEEISITATVKNDKYIFTGWYDGETLLTEQLTYTFTMPDKNINYVAKWTYFSLTAEKNIDEAGTVSPYSDTPVKSGSSITLTATTNDGYTFLGWYDGEKLLSTELSYKFTMPAESVVYAAKWMLCPVTLVKSIEEAGAVSGVSVTRIGEEVTVTATTNDGYTFLGWYEGEKQLTEQSAYSFVMSDEALTLTAKWTYYTLTTNTNDENGGTYTVKNEEKVTAGASVTVTAMPESGYTFLGWYNSDELLSLDMSYTFTMPAQNAVYTAKWTECPVTVEKSFDEAGSVRGLDLATYLGQEITLTVTTNEGYTWLGWYENEKLLTKELSYTFVMATTARTITATWAAYTLTTVAENPDAGSVTEYDEENIAEGTSVTVTATTSLGYNFLGWFEEDELLCEEESYTFDMPAMSVVYTAKWSAYTITVQTEDGGSVTAYNAYTVTFHKNTGSGDDVYAEQYVSAVQPLTMPSNPSEYLKVFKGWYNEPECKTKFDFSAEVTADTDVYADWYTYKKGSGYQYTSISEFDGSASASYRTFLDGTGTTATTGNYYYFAVLTSGTYKLTFQNYSSTYSIGLQLYKANNGVNIHGVTVAKSANTSVTFNASAGDVFYLVLYKTTTSNEVSGCAFLNKTSTSEPFIGGYGAGVGEIPVGEEKVVALGERVILKAVPKAGYTFLGWFKDNESEPESRELDYYVIMTEENVTYTAKWSKDTD